MEEFIQLITKTYGIAGLLMLSPLLAVAYLYREVRNKEAEMRQLTKETAEVVNTANLLMIDAHKSRVEDALKVSTRLIEVASEQSALNKETNIALERINELIKERRA